MSNEINNTTFEQLGISPISNLNLVCQAQLPDYLGKDKTEISKARAKLRKELKGLGMTSLCPKEVISKVPGVTPIGTTGYRLPIAGGGTVDVTLGRTMYYTAPALARLLAGMEQIEVKAERYDSVAVAGLQVFNNPEFGRVRVILRNGEPWFVLKDVCGVLGMDTSKIKQVSDRLDADEKGRYQIPTPGGTQETWVINESGLYNVILRSDKPKAKPFRKWVTSEVLPSIRKHGMYATDQLLNDPDLAIAAFTALKEERNKNATLTAKVQTLNYQIEEDRPKVALADSIISSKDTMKLGDFAKVISKRGGIQIGRNTLFKWMREEGILQKQSTIPYQNYLTAGYFEVAEVIKYGHIVKVLYITGKGQAYIHNRLLKSFAKSHS